MACCLQEDEELEAEMGLALESTTPKHPLEQALQLLEQHDATGAAKLLEQHTGASDSGSTGKQLQQQQLQQQPEQQSLEQQVEEPEPAEQQQQHADEQLACGADGEQAPIASSVEGQVLEQQR
jgi:hypothetical protein